MANVVISRTHIKANDGSVGLTSTSLTASNVYYIDAKGADYKTAMIFTNANSTAATVTVHIGDGIGGAGEDLKFSVAQNAMIPIVVDSSYYKIANSTDVIAEGKEAKGHIKVTVSAGCSVAVVELP